MSDLDVRVGSLEAEMRRQRSLNADLINQLDTVQYELALLLRSNPDVRRQAAAGFGRAALDGTSVVHGAHGEQDWLWIDASATTIGTNAFYGSRLTEVLVSRSANLETIGSFAFCACKALKGFIAPRSLTVIQNRAFYGAALCTVLFPADSLLRVVGGCAFAYTRLEAVELPASLIVVGDSAFSHCPALASVAFLGTQCSSIGRSAFSGCRALRAFRVPPLVTEVPARCFCRCESLESFAFAGTAVVRIGAGAFESCTRLQSVSIPSSVRVLGSRANQITPLSGARVAVDDMVFANASFEIGVFQNCGALSNVLMARNAELEEIGERCFARCARLQSVGYAPRLRLIGPAAFEGCTLLAQLPSLAAVEQIGDRACAECVALKAVRLSPDIRIIGSRAFRNCAALEQVTFGEQPEGGEINFPARLSLACDAFCGCVLLRGVRQAAPESRAVSAGAPPPAEGRSSGKRTV